jgi:hypothetical protein
MATYGEVKADFLALLNRRIITTAQTTTFLQNAIRRIQRNLRIPAMEQSVTITIDSTDADGVLIPSDYLELIRIQNSDGEDLDLRDLRMVKAVADDGGVPRIYARQTNKWVFGPTPAEDDTLRADYYAEFAEVSADDDENLLTITAPDLMMYCALIYAAQYFNDNRLPAFLETYNGLMSEIEDQSKRDELSAGAMVSPAYSFPSDDT